MRKPSPVWRPTPTVGSRTLPAEGIALTIQSVGKCVQDLIFGGKFWIERRADETAAAGSLSDHVENRLVRPRVMLSGHPLSQSGGHGDSRTRAESYAGCGCGAEIGMVPNIADGVDEVRRAVRTQLRRGADAIKVMAGGRGGGGAPRRRGRAA